MYVDAFHGSGISKSDTMSVLHLLISWLILMENDLMKFCCRMDGNET